MLKGAVNGRYNELLQSLAENMTSDIFNRMKNFVQGNINLQVVIPEYFFKSVMYLHCIFKIINF